MMKASTISAVALLAACASTATAGLTVKDLETAAPPAFFIGRPMTYQDNPDPRGEFAQVTDILFGGVPRVFFDIPLDSRIVGSSWGTWSHGYTDSVYWTQGATSLNMTFAAGVTTCVFYAEPNPFDTFDITATSIDGDGDVFTLTLSVTGDSGAKGWAIAADNGETLVSVNVTSTVDFAVGEFGVSSALGPCSPGDINADGVINVGDFFAFIAMFAAGCP